MNHVLALDDLDHLDFVGEPFDPDVRATAPARSSAPPEPGPRPVVPRPMGATRVEVQAALDDYVRAVRSAVADAHASALDAVHQLQHRAAAQLLAPTDPAD